MQNVINYKNIKVSFSEKGKGSAVVLLHGFLENSTIWNVIADELCKRNRVICVDLLGHGKSDCLGYIHTMEEMATAVKAVLKHLNIRRVTFVGHSMGGYVALAFAKKYPKNVKGICLLNATSQSDSQERIQLRLRAIEMAKKNYNTLVKMSITNLFAINTSVKLSCQIENLKEQALQTSVKGYIACSKGMILRENLEELLKKANFKKLIITGKEDPILNVVTVKKESIATKTPLIVLNGGHMSYLENEKEVITYLKEFLKKKIKNNRYS